jgi:hypothetical protein
MILLWDQTRPAAPAVLVGHEGTIASVAFSPAGEMLASASWGGVFDPWPLRLRSTHDDAYADNGFCVRNRPTRRSGLDRGTDPRPATRCAESGWPAASTSRRPTSFLA